jgi:hypothetical protein
MSRMTVHLLLLTALVLGCDRNDMRDQPRYEPFEASEFYADGTSARPIIAGTVPRGPSSTTRPADVVRTSGGPNAFPFPVTRQVLSRGRQRYTIYCSPCHGDLGDGNGMIVQRGFTRPPSFHDPRLVKETTSHYYDVISNGFGAMYSYNDRIGPDDRYAIIAYIRALQLSQRAPLNLISDTDRKAVQK